MDIPEGEWPRFAARALGWSAAAIAAGTVQRLAMRRAFRTEPRVALGATATWAVGTLVHGRRKFLQVRRARQP